MSVSLPLRDVLLYASCVPSSVNSAPLFWLRLPSVSIVTSRVPKSNQYSCENSLPPTSYANTKPSCFAAAGTGVMPPTGSG